MFTNNYQIYQQQNRLRWLTVLYDLALNRFRYTTDLPLFNQRYFEKQLIDTGKSILVYDNDIFNYLSLGCTFNSYNVYQEPVTFTAIGYDYSKDYNIGAWCIDNYSDYCLKDIINQYANDLSNIDTTLYFLTKKLKQPYIFKVSNNKRLNANILMNQIENSDFIEISNNFDLNDIELLNLNVNNTSIEQLQDTKTKRFNEILQLIGIDTISNEKSERLTAYESQIDNDKINRFLSSALQSRLDFCKRAKDLFDVDIQVSINKYNNLDVDMKENSIYHVKEIDDSEDKLTERDEI